MASVFDTLSVVNVNEHTEKKKTGGTELTYLSWPWAWSEVKQRYPGAHYDIWKDEQGRPYTYDPQTGYMVYTDVTIDGENHSMWLPVMDGANNAMKSEAYDYTVKNPNFKYAKWDDKKNGYFDRYGNRQEETITKHVAAATMFDINKTIMRCLVKNLAMFGLGLYIYAGEDLPDGEPKPADDDNTPQSPEETRAEIAKARARREAAADNVGGSVTVCEKCGKPIKGFKQGSNAYKSTDVMAWSREKFGKNLCYRCYVAQCNDLQRYANEAEMESLHGDYGDRN